MVRKFIYYSVLLLAFLLAGIFSFYISKVYFLKEPIIIDNYFLKEKLNFKAFLSKRINVDQDRIQLENVELKINDLKNFLNFYISKIEIKTELNETIVRSNNLHIKVSLLDLAKGLVNNHHLLLKNLQIDKIEFEISDNQKLNIENDSLIDFIRKIDHESSNLFENLKINQFNFNFKNKESIFKSNLLFECKSFNFDVFEIKKDFLLKCVEKTTKSGVIIKGFNYDKKNIYVDGYVEKFNLKLLQFKNFFRHLKLDGELNSYFKIDLSSNLNVEKVDLKIFDDSKLFNIINGKQNKLKLNGFVNVDLKRQTLFFKNLLINNYNLDGNVLKKDSKLLSNLRVSFDKSKFEQTDTYVYETITKYFFSKNKKYLNLINNSGLNQLKSDIKINFTFDTLNQEFRNLSINSKGYYSFSLSNKNLDEFIRVSTNLNGFYYFKYEDDKYDLKVNGKFQKVKFKFIKLDEIYNLSEIDYSINLVNNKLTIDKLNLINDNNKIVTLKSVFLRKKQNYYFTDLKIDIKEFPAKYFTHIYFQKFKKNENNFKFDGGKIVNSKIYITKNKLDESARKKLEIIDLNFVNFNINNNQIRFKNLNLTKKTDKVFIGKSKFFINDIPFNANFEINKSGLIRAFGTIDFNKDLKSLIFSKASFQIESKNLLKFKAYGSIKEKNFDIKVRSILSHSSFFHKVLNLNARNIKKGFVDLNLIFKNGMLKKIKNFLINYDDNEFRSNFDFLKPDYLKISKIFSKNFIAETILIKKEKDRFDIKIDGDLVDISHLANDLIKDQRIDNVNVKFDIISKKIILNEKFSLSGNLNGNFENNKFISLAKGKIVLGSNTLLDAGQLNILVEKGNYLLKGQGSLNSGKTKVKIKSSGNGLPIVIFESLEGGKLLSALGFTNKIKSGNIKIKVNFLDEDLLEYEGFINAKKFRVINAPKIVKSLSSLSFSGINSLFVGEGVGFIVGDAKFKKIGKKLKFEKILINNQTLSIYLEGNYDLSSESIKFTGSIAPFSTVSKFISVVPAVGELLTGSNKKGVISGQFKLYGKASDPEIDINVLSFSPGILRQIFSKNWLKEIKD